MQSHLVKQLVLTISECVPSTAGQNTIINALQRQSVIIATRDGPAAAIAYLKDELKSWREELELFRQAERRKINSRRYDTTFNMVVALIAATPTATDLLFYLGYLPI